MDLTTSLNTSFNHKATQESLVLELFYNNRPVVILPEQTPFHLGRNNNQAELSVNCEFASRDHCVIEFHGDKFILKDSSRNGTFVQLGSSQVFHLQQEATPLIGNGSFKLGASFSTDDAERILFKVKTKAPTSKL
jgi:adenylate cyclase